VALLTCLKHQSQLYYLSFSEFYENAIEGLHAGDAQQILIDAGYKIFDLIITPPANPFATVLRKGYGEFLAIPVNLYGSV